MTTTAAVGQWVEVRCKSPRCTTPGGRLLYVQSADGMISVSRRKRGLVVAGPPLALWCDCGWVWRSPSLGAPDNRAGDAD